MTRIAAPLASLAIAIGTLPALTGSCILRPAGAPTAQAVDPESFDAPIPALRYQKNERANAPSQDAPFRVSGPLVSASAPPTPLRIHSSTLENGLRLVVVERHAFPMVAARLIIGIASATTDDVGGRRAYLLGGTFLSPLERVVWTSAGCGVDSCFVASRGPSEQLGQVLDRIAELASGSHTAPAAYQERLYAFKRQFDQAESGLTRNLRALLFGPTHRYGGPPAEDVPTLAELERLRAKVFVPSAATLVVVGDTTEEAVRTEASQKFARWSGMDARSGPDAHPLAPAGPPPLPDMPRIVLFRNRAIAQVWGTVGARGPGLGSPDAPAFVVLARVLGGNYDSTLFHHVREDLGLAYTIGAHVNWYRDLSLMSLTGSFESEEAIRGVRGLLAAIDAVRSADPPADAVERAKAATIAAIRHQMATDEGIASDLAGAVSLGLDVEIESKGHFGALVAAVSAADVGAVARRYLHPDVLRVVLMGRPEAVRGAPSLGLGDPVWTDLFGRPLPPAGR